ncbi:MAG: PRC-barrel domain-containing protein, partial [Rhodospirillales bacterium]
MLKKTLLAGAAATMLIGAPVVSMTAFAQPSPTATMPSSDSIKIDKLIGRNVVNAQNEKIGDINSVYVGKNGKVDSIIVGVGGFLGMGEREVAVKWSDLTVSNGGEKIMVNATKDQLKAMPEYKYSDKSYRGAVFGDSGVTHPPMAADRAGMDRSNQKTTQTNTLPSTVAPKGGADRTGMDRTTQKTSPTGDTSTTTVPNTRADRTGMDRNTQGVNRNPAMMVHGEMSGNAIIG